MLRGLSHFAAVSTPDMLADMARVLVREQEAATTTARARQLDKLNADLRKRKAWRP